MLHRLFGLLQQIQDQPQGCLTANTRQAAELVNRPL